MKKHLKPEGTTDTWITPKYLTEALGHFDLDPCAHLDMPWTHTDNNYTIHDNGLTSEWNGRVWLNPPFNRNVKAHWMKKMSEHKNGIMLIPASLEVDDFKKYVWGKATGILALDHRPYFHRPDGSKKGNSGQTMCLISYDEYNFQSLVNCGLGYMLTEYKQAS